MEENNLNMYGIVYKITNRINNKTYIGITTSKRGFKGRYSAKGKGIERVYNFNERQQKNNKYVNIHLFNAIKKYGFEAFQIDEKFDISYSEEELKNKEKYWISYYKSNNLNYGYNRTEGGDSSPSGENSPLYGKPKSKEHRQKLSEWAKTRTGIKNPNYNNRGKLNPIYGIKRSEETRKRVGDSKRGKNNPNYGKNFSEEHRQKLSESQKKRYDGNTKEVICLNTNEVFSSYSEACLKYNLKNQCSIGAVCQGKRKSAGKDLITGEKLKWMYYNDYILKLNDNSCFNIKKDITIRNIFLDMLPRKEGIGALKGEQVIDWKKSIGYKVKFTYNDIEGLIKIVGYKKGYLYIKYIDKDIYKIQTNNFQKCKLKNLLYRKENDNENLHNAS